MKISNFFLNNQDFDKIERLIALLQYVGFLIDSNSSSISSDDIYDILEKGSLYRGMLKTQLENKSLHSQVTLIMDKFSELNERFHLLESSMNIMRMKISELFSSFQDTITQLISIVLQLDSTINLFLLLNFNYFMMVITIQSSESVNILIITEEGSVELFNNMELSKLSNFLLSKLSASSKQNRNDSIETLKLEIVFLLPNSLEDTEEHYFLDTNIKVK